MPGIETFLISLGTTYGPLGIFAVMWYIERRYNQENTKAVIDLYAAAVAQAAAIKQLLEERLPRR